MRMTINGYIWHLTVDKNWMLTLLIQVEVEFGFQLYLGFDLGSFIAGVARRLRTLSGLLDR